MQLRVLFSIVNIGIFIVLFVLEFTIPIYSSLIFYVLLGWFVGSFLLLRAPFMSREVGRPKPQPSMIPAGSPLPSGGTPPIFPEGDELGFCPYCATHLAPGTLVCPSCGKSTRIG